MGFSVNFIIHWGFTEMDFLTWVVTFIVVFTVVYILQFFNRFNRLFDKVPGPICLPIIGSMHFVIGMQRKDIMPKVRSLTSEYNPLFRLWVGPYPHLVIHHPKHLEVIASHINHINKSFAYDIVRPWLGEGLLMSTGKKWHSRRKLITPTFHFSILDTFLEVFDEKSRILVDKLRMETGAEPFDVFPYISKCALDIICETAMGTTSNIQQTKNSKYLSAVYTVTELTMERAIRPWLHNDTIYSFTKKGKIFREKLQFLHDFTRNVIREKRGVGVNQKIVDEEIEGKKKRMAFLDLLLQASDNGHYLSENDLCEEVDTFMFEGHDTTTVGMGWTLLMLGIHPDVQDRVIEELDVIFEGSNRAATMQDLSAMKYLEMVIKESLRLFPSVPFIGRKLTEDVQIGEYLIPTGTHIILNIFETQRSKEFWGPNADRFDPDNFLPERAQGRHPFAYLPFSAGPRNCIGQKFALLEEKVVLSNILRNYRVKSLDKLDEIPILPELILRSETGFRITVLPR